MLQIKPPRKSYLFLLPWSLAAVGGVNQVVENLMRQVKQDGRYKPMLMVNSWGDTKMREQNIKGYDHHFFRLRNPWDHFKPFHNFIAFCGCLGWNWWQFLRFIRSNKIAIINVHYCSLYVLNISFLKAVRLFSGRLILSFHGTDLLVALQTKGIERALWKIMLGSADSIVTCSEFLKKDLILFDDSCEKKIDVIHNGIDVSFLEEKRDKNYRLDPSLKEHKFILNIGTFEYIKGQDILLKAFKKITGDFPDLHLVLIGRPGKALKHLKLLISSLGLAHRVWIYEDLSHDKISAFFEKAMVFTLPSRYESFGIVILEAGIFSVPVVASNVGGIREILNHAQTGRMCEPENIEGLACELAYLLKRPEERIRLGENLRKHVLKNYSWAGAYRKYLDRTEI